MPVCHTGDRGSKSRRDRHFDGPVAQLVEQWTENPCVASSILAWTTIFSTEQVLSGAFFVTHLSHIISLF